MNPNHFGALVCRGVGLLLLIVGAASVLPAFFGGSPSDAIIQLGSSRPPSGWTSYAPMGQPPASPPTYTEFIVSGERVLLHRLPFVLEGFAGIVLLLFSRPFGRLLARGLSGPAA